MITLQKNAISTIFENIFCYFSITHDALRPRPFYTKHIILFSGGIVKQKFQFKAIYNKRNMSIVRKSKRG